MSRPDLRPAVAVRVGGPDLHLDLDPAALAADLDHGWSARPLPAGDSTPPDLRTEQLVGVANR